MSAAVYGSKRPQTGQQRPQSGMRPQSGLNRTIHDPQLYASIKQEQSAPYFRNTRVSTCSHIKQDHQGRAVAIQYPLQKTGWKNPASYQNMNKLTHTESLNTTHYM